MVGSAAREFLLVIMVAAVGLLLATAVAFGPWPVTPGGSAPSGLVDLQGPAPADRFGSASG